MPIAFALTKLFLSGQFIHQILVLEANNLTEILYRENDAPNESLK